MCELWQGRFNVFLLRRIVLIVLDICKGTPFKNVSRVYVQKWIMHKCSNTSVCYAFAIPILSDRCSISSVTYSKISPGWQFKALQIASKVLNRIAFAFPVFRIERLDNVRSTLSESSFRETFRFAIITSKFTMIGIAKLLNRFRFEFQLPF